jgi:hypothetical protein|tara:strand:+ start:443 stop:697 length:255 start_codon:yes stop_codon:yes gene_type:complete
MDSYAWIDAAGELEILARLGTHDAKRYAADCEQNFNAERDNGEWESSYVTSDTVWELWELLSAQWSDGTFVSENKSSFSVQGRL